MVVDRAVERNARGAMVGEQPGDQEDLAGRPFVGPASRVPDRVIAEAGIDACTRSTSPTRSTAAGGGISSARSSIPNSSWRSAPQPLAARSDGQ
jgi:uracil-DNA glycosylase